PTLSFLHPFGGVTIPFKADIFRLLDVLTENVDNSQAFFSPFFDLFVHCFVELIELLSNDQIEYRKRGRTVIASTHGAEFKLVPCKGERRCAVAVCRIKNNLRNLCDSELHIHVIALLDLHISFALEFIEYS